jgi:hypothetical protein
VNNHLLPDLLIERDFEYFQKYSLEHHTLFSKQVPHYGMLSIQDTPELRLIHEKILPAVRQVFDNELLIPTWQQLNLHCGPQSTLPSRKFSEHDAFGVSLVAYQQLGWPTSIGGETFELSENEGLFFTANQTFERLPFPDPFNNVLANAFFFFIQP